MTVFQSVTKAKSEKKIPSSPKSGQSHDRPVPSPDALPLSYRRLMEARPLKVRFT